MPASSPTPHETGAVGFAAIVGRPNVGKSTLLNQMLGETIAIVSPRPQTTRNRILGVKTTRQDGAVSQLILLDTPGIHRRRATLNRFMVQQALDSLSGADCVLLMTEVKQASAAPLAELDPRDVFVLEQVQHHREGAPVIIVINKIDRLQRPDWLLPLMRVWKERGFDCIVPTCARSGAGLDVLLTEILSRLPTGPLLYPEDMITDQADPFLAAELIREQIFHGCAQEVPYSTAVEVVAFAERGHGREAENVALHVEALIHVEQESQRGILIGKGGSMIKAIGSAARASMSRVFGCPVHLHLEVHVERGWSRTPAGRRKLGYE